MDFISPLHCNVSLRIFACLDCRPRSPWRGDGYEHTLDFWHKTDTEEIAWLIFNTCCALVLPFIELLAHFGKPLRMARSAAAASAKGTTVQDSHNRSLTAAASVATLNASDASDVTKSYAAPDKLSNNRASVCSDNLFVRIWRFYVPPMSKTAAVYLALFLVWEFLAFWLPLKRRLLNTRGIRQPGYSSYFRQVSA
jgi:hypothetical protein